MFLSGKLGCVDGFYQHQAARETHDRRVAGDCLFAAHGDTLEALELADGLLDTRSEFVDPLRKEPASLLGVLPPGNDRGDAARAGGVAVGLAVISLVGHRDARADIRADVERRLELDAVADLAAGEVEVEGASVEVGLEVDFGGEATARAPERLVLLPPFAPAAETCARAVVLSKNWTRCAVSLHSASNWKNTSNTPERLSRQNRFQTLFQFPYSLGNARQVML